MELRQWNHIDYEEAQVSCLWTDHLFSQVSETPSLSSGLGSALLFSHSCSLEVNDGPSRQMPAKFFSVFQWSTKCGVHWLLCCFALVFFPDTYLHTHPRAQPHGCGNSDEGFHSKGVCAQRMHSRAFRVQSYWPHEPLHSCWTPTTTYWVYCFIILSPLLECSPPPSKSAFPSISIFFHDNTQKKTTLLSFLFFVVNNFKFKIWGD